MAEEKDQIECKFEFFDGTRDELEIGFGDSMIFPSFLDRALADDAFEALKPSTESEIHYYQMYHMLSNNPKQKKKALKKGELLPLQRIKGVQADRDVEDGAVPLYRFSVNCQSKYPVLPVSPTVDRIRKLVEEKINQKLNHAVVLCYRTGDDMIGPHQDKTLDIEKDSYIVSISLGAERYFEFTKLDGTHRQRLLLPHGSLLVIGPRTNELYKHALPRQKFEVSEGRVLEEGTPELLKSEIESQVGMRISVTLRLIETYLKPDGTIRGQGSNYETQDWPFGEHCDLPEPQPACNPPLNARE
jgi:alkylated DNA repair dioxygenase AlkB